MTQKSNGFFLIPAPISSLLSHQISPSVFKPFLIVDHSCFYFLKNPENCFKAPHHQSQELPGCSSSHVPASKVRCGLTLPTQQSINPSLLVMWPTLTFDLWVQNRSSRLTSIRDRTGARRDGAPCLAAGIIHVCVETGQSQLVWPLPRQILMRSDSKCKNKNLVTWFCSSLGEIFSVSLLLVKDSLKIAAETWRLIPFFLYEWVHQLNMKLKICFLFSFTHGWFFCPMTLTHSSNMFFTYSTWRKIEFCHPSFLNYYSLCFGWTQST